MRSYQSEIRRERNRVATGSRILETSFGPIEYLGLLNEAAIVTALPRYELERIATPTLIISARDDLYNTFAGSRYSAAVPPDQRSMGYGNPVAD
jgi:pimeloyl-ACP methyl ester carboxylesterase